MCRRRLPLAPKPALAALHASPQTRTSLRLQAWVLLPRALARLFPNLSFIVGHHYLGWAGLPPLSDDDAEAATVLHASTRVLDAGAACRLYRLHYPVGTRAWAHRPQAHKQCMPMGSLAHGTVILAAPSSTAGWLKLAGGLGYVKQTVRGLRAGVLPRPPLAAAPAEQ